MFAAGNTHAGFDRHCKMNDFIRFRDQVRSEEAASETYPGGTGFASAGVTAENNSAPVPESRTLLSPVALWGCGIPHRRLRIPRGLATEHHSAQNGTTGNFYKEISMPERARASKHSFRPGFCAVVAVIAAVGLGPVVSFVLGGQVPEGTATFTPQTKVSITAERWCLNGEVTYRGTRAEGLLMNVRMVNSVFEDRHKPDYRPRGEHEPVPVAPDRLCRARRPCLHDLLAGRQAPLRRGSQFGVRSGWFAPRVVSHPRAARHRGMRPARSSGHPRLLLPAARPGPERRRRRAHRGNERGGLDPEVWLSQRRARDRQRVRS